jgi:hypothetical protein
MGYNYINTPTAKHVTHYVQFMLYSNSLSEQLKLPIRVLLSARSTTYINFLRVQNSDNQSWLLKNISDLSKPNNKA